MRAETRERVGGEVEKRDRMKERRESRMRKNGESERGDREVRETPRETVRVEGRDIEKGGGTE